MKIYKKLIKPVMLVPASANDYSPKKVPIEPEEKWYPEENREALAKKYEHLETTFEALIFEEKYEEVDFALLKDQEPENVLSMEHNRLFPGFYNLTGNCPGCHKYIEQLTNRHYCGYCGKGLIWDE